MIQSLYMRASNAQAAAARAVEQLGDARVEAVANDAAQAERMISGAIERLRRALAMLEQRPVAPPVVRAPARDAVSP